MSHNFLPLVLAIDWLPLVTATNVSEAHKHIHHMSQLDNNSSTQVPKHEQIAGMPQFTQAQMRSTNADSILSALHDGGEVRPKWVIFTIVYVLLSTGVYATLNNWMTVAFDCASTRPSSVLCPNSRAKSGRKLPISITFLTRLYFSTTFKYNRVRLHHLCECAGLRPVHGDFCDWHWSVGRSIRSAIHIPQL